MKIIKTNQSPCYLTEFSEYLGNDATANSYKSGMKQLINWYNQNIASEARKKVKSFPEFIMTLEQISSENIVNTFFSFVRVQLYNKIARSTSTSEPTKETLYNRISYLNSFQAFWVDNKLKTISAQTIAKGVLDFFKKSSQDVTYSQTELIYGFVSRLVSQDRISSSKKILFPIRLMNKIWKTETQKWAEEYAKSIYIIIEENNGFKEVQIKNIESINIKSGKEVSVRYKGKDCIVYTSYSDPYEHLVINSKEIQYYRKRTPITDLKTSFVSPFEIDSKQNVIIDKEKKIWHVKPMVVAHLGEIAIDHDIPIALILEEKAKQLVGLSAITNLYKKISEGYNLTVSQKNANEFSAKYSKEFLEAAKKEAIEFPQEDMKVLSKCKLVLMQGDENGKKSDN